MLLRNVHPFPSSRAGNLLYYFYGKHCRHHGQHPPKNNFTRGSKNDLLIDAHRNVRARVDWKSCSVLEPHAPQPSSSAWQPWISEEQMPPGNHMLSASTRSPDQKKSQSSRITSTRRDYSLEPNRAQRHRVQWNVKIEYLLFRAVDEVAVQDPYDRAVSHDQH